MYLLCKRLLLHYTRSLRRRKQLAGASTAFFPTFLVGGLGALFVVAYTLNDIRHRAPNSA